MKAWARGAWVLLAGLSGGMGAVQAGTVTPPAPLDFGPDQYVQVVRVLEQFPLDKDLLATRPMAMSWLQATPKVTIRWTVCPVKMPWVLGAKNKDPASFLLFSQDLLENAATQIQEATASRQDQETHALEGTLRMYEHLRTQKGMQNLQAEAIRNAYRTHGATALKSYTCAGTVNEDAPPGTMSADADPVTDTNWVTP
jgi:hypothetical protein